MKRTFTIAVVAFTIGLIANNFAVSDTGYKLGVVDLQEVAAASSDVRTLRDSQAKQIKGLQDIINKARTELEKEPDKAKQNAIQEKYNKELNVKKDAIDNEYTRGLKAIDEKIKQTVERRAQKDDYTIVVNKSSVLYGGNDITQTIISDMK